MARSCGKPACPSRVWPPHHLYGQGAPVCGDCHQQHA
jgi:hypothetical protein